MLLSGAAVPLHPSSLCGVEHFPAGPAGKLLCCRANCQPCFYNLVEHGQQKIVSTCLVMVAHLQGAQHQVRVEKCLLHQQCGCSACFITPPGCDQLNQAAWHSRFGAGPYAMMLPQFNCCPICCVLVCCAGQGSLRALRHLDSSHHRDLRDVQRHCCCTPLRLHGCFASQGRRVFPLSC